MRRLSDRSSTNVALAAVIVAGLALTACTSPEKALDPSAIKPADTIGTTPDIASPGSPAIPSPSPGSSSPVPASLSQTTIQLAPVVGPTVEAAKPLSARLVERVRERGIQLAGTDGTPTLVVKGYFSAMTEAGQTTVIYVWDVLDTGGNRLHRIQGQEKAAAATGEGWSSVTAPTMQRIADQTVDQLATWLSTRNG